MDDAHWVLTFYVRELVYQDDAAQRAATDLTMALQSSEATAGIPRAFAAAQALLSAGAMTSKLLWPSTTMMSKSERAKTVQRGKDLRASLEIREIPILKKRTVRNALEHFDARLDRFFETGTRTVIDRNVMPKGAVVGPDGPILHLRLIDPAAGTISVLDDEIGIQDLRSATAHVAAKAKGWLSDHDPSSGWRPPGPLL